MSIRTLCGTADTGIRPQAGNLLILHYHLPLIILFYHNNPIDLQSCCKYLLETPIDLLPVSHQRLSAQFLLAQQGSIGFIETSLQFLQ